jgi:hypothetical protein
MPFTSEQAKALAARRKQDFEKSRNEQPSLSPPPLPDLPAGSEQHVSLDDQNQAAAEQVARDKAEAEFFFVAPLAEADQLIKDLYVKQRIPVPPGPWKNPSTQEVEDRPGGYLVFYEGEAATREPSWAAYVREQWPTIKVLSTKPAATEVRKYREELARIKEQALAAHS